MKYSKVAPYILILASASWLSACGNHSSGARVPKSESSSQSQTWNSSYSYPVPAATNPVSDGSEADDFGSTPAAEEEGAPLYVSSGSNPGNYTQALGTSLTLYAQFKGSPEPTYQWYKDNQLIAGATDATLDVVSITRQAYGTYILKATNSYGNAQSQPFTLSPVVMVGQVGSRECNNAQCWTDKQTAGRVCQQKFGNQSELYSDVSFAPAYVKYHSSFCSWNGSGWSCDTSCGSSCNGFNVLGYVQCLQ